jgi:hypothetical protein
VLDSRMSVGSRKWFLTIGAACIAELRDYFNSLGSHYLLPFTFISGLLNLSCTCGSGSQDTVLV